MEDEKAKSEVDKAAEDEQPADETSDDKTAQEDASKEASSTSMIDAATQAAERLEKVNEALSKNLDRQEKLDARRMLGGRAEAGQEVKPKTREEKDQEVADSWMKEE